LGAAGCITSRTASCILSGNLTPRFVPLTIISEQYKTTSRPKFISRVYNVNIAIAYLFMAAVGGRFIVDVLYKIECLIMSYRLVDLELKYNKIREEKNDE
jgi:hypothetical protein